ncbi:MAG TPA: M56 family metallopeptidase [Candidatus Acidoferrales bacterium]
MTIARNYEPIIAFLVAWAAKATVVLGLAWIVVFALRGHSAALRHRVWAIAIVSSLALPLVAFAVPAWHVISHTAIVAQTVSQTTLAVDSAPLPASAAEPAHGLDVERLIAAGLLIWALGTMLVALKLFAGLARLWRISAYSTKAPENACATLDELRALFGIKRRVRLLQSASATTMPMTWGVFGPRVVLPSGAAEWDAERQRIVLSHELAHVLRNDWLLQFCAEVLRACFWFHPLAWIAARRVRQESERACDDAVLNSGIAAPEYASQLLALAKTLKTPSWRFSLALAVARPSNLERRFAAMLNPSISRTPLSRKGNVVAISLGACLLLPLAALTLSAATANGASPTAALAQSEMSATNQSVAVGDGSISGTIIDQHGTGILGANVTLTSALMRTARNVATGPDGKFLFSQLPPGLYVINIERRGFRSDPPRNILVALHGRAKMATIRLALADPAASAASPTRSNEAASAANAAFAQAAQSGPVGSISGSIGDPSGAMIPRANVTLTDVATGQQQQIAAGPVGEFSFSNLSPDGYELSVTQPGFQVFKETLQLYPGEQVKLPELLLRVGEVSQTISISASRTAAARVPMPPASMVPVLACSAQTAQATPLVSRNPVEGGAGSTPARVRVGGMVEAARLIDNTVPIYPESARTAGVQGTVVFNAVIGKDGSLLSTCVVNSQVNPALIQSAMAGISQWRYSPALLNGEPIEVATEIAVVYTLTN